MEFKVKQGHISYPEILKRDLDQETRHGYEVVDVQKNNLQLEKSVKTYNFLIPQNSKELRDIYKQSGYGYVELYVRKKYIRAFGLSFTVVERPTRNNANYLLVKSVHREPVEFYKEFLHEYHDEETKKFLPLTIIYAILYGINLIMQPRVVKQIGVTGYYILSGVIIVLLVVALYNFLRHKQFKEDLE